MTDATTPTPTDKAVARMAAEAFGGTPSVHRYHDEDESNAVDLLSCRDTPVPGYATYSTLGLWRSQNELDGRQVSVELAGVCDSAVTLFPNTLSTSAFYVMKDEWLCAPGVVFPDMLTEYDLSPNLRHLLWMPPFAWPDLSAATVAPAVAVHWLVGIPISEAERRFLHTHGLDDFERLLEQSDAPYYDLNRPSLV